MAIFTPSVGDNPSVPTPDGPKAYDAQFRPSIVESRYNNTTSLLSNVTGTPVRVNYYRQYLGKDEQAMGFQMDNVAVYQSYTLIHNLILKFQGKPGYSFDTDKAESTETGTAYVIFDLAPLTGDMFMRDIGDGRAGLYQVEGQPELFNFSADKVYLITFKLLYVVTAEVQANLDSRVVKELHYSKDSVLKGGNALLTSEDVESVKELMKMSYVITQLVLETGYYNPEETIVIPKESSADDIIYDPFLAKFLSYVLPLKEVFGSKPINLISTQVGVNYNYTAPKTVWDAILLKSPGLLAVAPKKLYLYSRRQFWGTRTYGGPIYTKIPYFLSANKLDYSGRGYLYMTPYNAVPAAQPEPITEINSYFSEGFYVGSPANLFEKLIYDMAFNDITDRKALLDYAKTIPTLPPKDILYQGGVIVLMIEGARRVLAGD